MWELIRANKRKSIVLLIGMAVCLGLLGYLIGAALSPKSGGLAGLGIAFGIWIILCLASYFSGDSIILAVSRAKEVSHDVHPQLFNVVEEMKIAANLPVMPKIYIIDEEAPNAFATGRSPEKSAIAVTAGLLSKLNRDQLQGVVAHEMSHIVNRDVLFMTLAGIMLGSIVFISEIFLRGMFFSSMSSRRYRSRRSSVGGGQAQLVLMLVAIVMAILSPIFAYLLYFSISRKREYLADASAVRLTRYPEGLASALERISSAHIPLTSANKVTAPMYIVNPLKAQKMKASGLAGTHPPIAERIRILRSMSGGANFMNYQQAFGQVTGVSAGIIPDSALKTVEDIPIREALAGKEQAKDKRGQKRDLGDLMRAVNEYAFLMCACGLKIKIPPDFKRSSLTCPKCKRDIRIPMARIAAVTAGITALGRTKIAAEKTLDGQGEGQGAFTPTQKYHKKSRGWETFSCSCGKLHQLSPRFSASRVHCNACGKNIEIQT